MLDYISQAELRDGGRVMTQLLDIAFHAWPTTRYYLIAFVGV
jgi:hypothetical protein